MDDVKALVTAVRAWQDNHDSDSGAALWCLRPVYESRGGYRVVTALCGVCAGCRLVAAVEAAERVQTTAVNIVFDGPPGPTAGRFIEVEDDNGQSIKAGKWINRGDGTWVLRIEQTKAGTVHELRPEPDPLRTLPDWGL